MTIHLDHAIVSAHDRDASGKRLAELLGVRCGPAREGPFFAVYINDGLTLDFYGTDEPFPVEHFCFRVGEDEFDQVFGRIRAQGLEHWADPGQRSAGRINTNDGGRGAYFEDPDGHLLEIITRPYGSAG